MKIYHFNLIYGHYTEESDAMESPRKPGDYLIIKKGITEIKIIIRLLEKEEDMDLYR